jgi:hypothetical protein
MTTATKTANPRTLSAQDADNLRAAFTKLLTARPNGQRFICFDDLAEILHKSDASYLKTCCFDQAKIAAGFGIDMRQHFMQANGRTFVSALMLYLTLHSMRKNCYANVVYNFLGEMFSKQCLLPIEVSSMRGHASQTSTGSGAAKPAEVKKVKSVVLTEGNLSQMIRKAVKAEIQSFAAMGMQPNNQVVPTSVAPDLPYGLKPSDILPEVSVGNDVLLPEVAPTRRRVVNRVQTYAHNSGGRFTYQETWHHLYRSARIALGIDACKELDEEEKAARRENREQNFEKKLDVIAKYNAMDKLMEVAIVVLPIRGSDNPVTAG